jgi:hypothetical protein
MAYQYIAEDEEISAEHILPPSQISISPTTTQTNFWPEKSRSLTMGFLWGQTNTASLIAWLDFCIQNGLNFQDTIIEHLKNTANTTTGESFLVTKLQADNKLVGLARTNGKRHGRRPYPGKAEIMRRGSVCFPELPKWIRQQIETNLRQYRAEHASLLQRKTPPQGQSPGNRGSQSKLPGVTARAISDQTLDWGSTSTSETQTTLENQRLDPKDVTSSINVSIHLQLFP